MKTVKKVLAAINEHFIGIFVLAFCAATGYGFLKMLTLYAAVAMGKM